MWKINKAFLLMNEEMIFYVRRENFRMEKKNFPLYRLSILLDPMWICFLSKCTIFMKKPPPFSWLWNRGNFFFFLNFGKIEESETRLPQAFSMRSSHSPMQKLRLTGFIVVIFFVLIIPCYGEIFHSAKSILPIEGSNRAKLNFFFQCTFYLSIYMRVRCIMLYDGRDFLSNTTSLSFLLTSWNGQNPEHLLSCNKPKAHANFPSNPKFGEI